ncbi:MAG: sensor histidine kinase [Verrucomicrobia bacterium]|nr:sensor histidine kinase [Verrucomicrobiota bacterium]
MDDQPVSRADAASSDATTEALPWSGFFRVLRRLSHNVRNHLNTAELEAAFAAEITTDADVRQSLRRMRQSFDKIARELESLLARLQTPVVEPIDVRGDEFFRALRQDSETHLGTATPIHWDWLPSAPERVCLDLDLACRIIRELLDNAIRYRSDQSRPLCVRAGGQPGRLELEIIEPKLAQPDLNAWATPASTSADPKRYGLGLWAVRQWLRAMNGELHRAYDEDQRVLVTRLSFATRMQSE